MVGKRIYPKTERISSLGGKVYITEKIDGSNLVFFKKDNVLYIAQRKNIYSIEELDEVKGICYKGLYEWLKNNGQVLIDELRDNSAICGEWIGMGKLKYNVDEFDKRWYMFAKANIDDKFNLYNLIYEHDLFIYPFISQVIPNFIGIVPEVTELRAIPTKEHLDSIYEKYRNKVGNRSVEGFVINYKNSISKYVRMKNGKLVEYSEDDHKGGE